MRSAGPAEAVGRCLREAVEGGVTPGAVALVARREEVLLYAAVGRAQVVPEPEALYRETPFDLASLTKPLATGLLAVLLQREVDLGPERPAGDLLPELADPDHREITLAHLLAHASGLPAWRPLFLRGETPAEYLRALRDEPLEARPGQRAIYSDPGYIAAGEMLSRAAGASLEDLFQQLVAQPAGVGLRFRPGAEMAARCAATEAGEEHERQMTGPGGEAHGRWRTATIRGQVHDHHAWIAGGVLGSAGLFGTAADLHRLGLELLGAGTGLLPPAGLERLRRPAPTPAGEARSQGGFALNRGGEGSCGAALPEAAFGHTGFTGTSLWVDPQGERIYVLLTNRIHPRVTAADMRRFRREFHRLAAAL